MDDYARVLTSEGITETENMGKRHQRLLAQCDVLFTSALLRAVETAELLYPRMPKADFELLSSLDKVAPPSEFRDFVRCLSQNKTYAFVGHEPQLSQSIHLILRSSLPLELKKSGILILEGRDEHSLNLTGLYGPSES